MCTEKPRTPVRGEVPGEKGCLEYRERDVGMAYVLALYPPRASKTTHAEGVAVHIIADKAAVLKGTKRLL
ncbi:hypothetical protein N7513_011095 [Penicillium frequentans]|nr:hypothetical protein N7513_011095 [Penicillium glabrum]